MIDNKGRARFWRKVNGNGLTVSHVANLGACWMWIGSPVSSGYGRMWVDGRPLLAHRISYEIHNGVEPGSLFVCHRCDVKLCVNPEHLFLGTQTDNARDMVAKGRNRPWPPGEGHHLAKLTEADVRSIRDQYAAGGVSQRALARRFGVAQSNIGLVISRRTWTHV